jgi:hypothetical protein
MAVKRVYQLSTSNKRVQPHGFFEKPLESTNEDADVVRKILESRQQRLLKPNK